jgi:hypothetical protein
MFCKPCFDGQLGDTLGRACPFTLVISEMGQKRRFLACPQLVQLGGNLGNAGCPGLPVEGIGLDVIQAPDRSLESYGLLLAHGYRNPAEVKSWMAKKGN